MSAKSARGTILRTSLHDCVRKRARFFMRMHPCTNSILALFWNAPTVWGWCLLSGRVLGAARRVDAPPHLCACRHVQPSVGPLPHPSPAHGHCGGRHRNRLRAVLGGLCVPGACSALSNISSSPARIRSLMHCALFACSLWRKHLQLRGRHGYAHCSTLPCVAHLNRCAP